MATPPKSPDNTTTPPKPPGGPQASSAKHPIAIVDFGKAQSRARVKRLRKGKGKLVARVEGIVEELMANPAMAEAGPHPVVVIVLREKPDGILGAIPGM